jgi:hypothetical protein
VCIGGRKKMFSRRYIQQHTPSSYTQLFSFDKSEWEIAIYGTIEKRAIDQLVRVMLTAELLFAAAGLCSSTKRRV